MKKNNRIYILILGIVLELLGLILPMRNIINILLCIFGIITLVFANIVERNNKPLFIVLFAIILSFLNISIDYLIVATMKVAPVFATSIITNGNTKVYNAIGYRVWDCKDDFKVDLLYKLGFYCSIDRATSIDINNVVIVSSNFEAYKDAYIKVNGRIKRIDDKNTIVLSPYKVDGSIINYSNDFELVIKLNVPITKDITVNAPVTVVGSINEMIINNGLIKIILVDGSFDSEKVEKETNAYNYTIDNNRYCQYDKRLWFEDASHIYYKSCINDFNITIGSQRYDFMYALKNNYITFDRLLDEATGYLSNSSDNSKIYTYDSFKVLVCDSSYSKDVIIGSNDLSFNNGYCKDVSTSGERGV